MVVMVVVMAVPVGAAMPDPREQHRGADADHEQPGDEPDPRVELLGDDELGEGERDEPEREDADGVRRRHDQPERRGVPRRPALADEIGRDDRLAVAGRERVRGAPEEGEPERDEDDADAEVVLRDQAREPVVRPEPPAPSLRARAGGREASPPSARRRQRRRSEAPRAGRPDRRGARRSRSSPGRRRTGAARRGRR